MPRRAQLFALRFRDLVVTRSRRSGWALVIAGLVISIAFDRGYWAEVAQWREDQACNLWIGYTQSLLAMPVGLISSVGTPNANGMPLLAVVLSRLPNLWVISTVLGLLQGVLVVWVCWLITGAGPLLLLLALPALTSVVLRATSVEFWNQWILVSFNLAFFGLWISYLRRPSPWIIVGLVWLMLYAPAVYLAGLVNAGVYFVFVVAALWMRPPRARWQRCAAPALVGLAVVGLALGLTWIPYARAMAGKELPVPGLTLKVGQERLLRSFESGLDFPHWTLTHWYRHTEEAFLQSSKQILGPSATLMLQATITLLCGQAVLFTVTLLLSLTGWFRTERPFASFFVEGRQFQGRMTFASMAFVMLAMMLSPLLGGPSWTKGERPDQQVQFLPFLLFAWFLLPFVVSLPERTVRTLRALTLLLALGFGLVSLGAGWQAVRSHLSYRGSVLSEADVPLAHQRQAMAFIAHDWISSSADKRIPVSYQHGQAWVIEFGKGLNPWYPAPMTIGRAFDFELRRVYGLTNAQEGVLARSAKSARYIVSYAFEPAPRVRGATATHHVFGRVRVSVLRYPRPHN